MGEKGVEDSVRDWQLWREDEYGKRFLVGDRLTESEALAPQAEYERRGHKQFYWSERSRRGA